MNTQSSMVHVRMDSELKRKATEALASMGLTASDAVRLLFHRIAVDQAFPLELKVPNARTRRAMGEVDEMVASARRDSTARTRCLPNLTKPAASKRTGVPRRVDYSSAFLKDWKRLSRSGRYDMTRMKAVMLQLIANDAPLGPERRDHALKGEWANYRECHVGGDFLLIYRSTIRTDQAARSTSRASARTRNCSGKPRRGPAPLCTRSSRPPKLYNCAALPLLASRLLPTRPAAARTSPDILASCHCNTC